MNNRDEPMLALQLRARPSFRDALLEYCRRHQIDVSQFIRDAIAEKLARLGVDVDPSAVSRQGKGGRKPANYALRALKGIVLNEAAAAAIRPSGSPAPTEATHPKTGSAESR